MNEFKMNSTLFTNIVNRIIDEYNKNEKKIYNGIISPLLTKIYTSISHYLYCIFILLLLSIVLNIVTIILIVVKLKS